MRCTGRETLLLEDIDGDERTKDERTNERRQIEHMVENKLLIGETATG
jgi:hypothetical protein